LERRSVGMEVGSELKGTLLTIPKAFGWLQLPNEIRRSETAATDVDVRLLFSDSAGFAGRAVCIIE